MEKQEIESYKKAGDIAKRVVAYARDFIKPGMLLIDIANKIDSKIDELGVEAAFPVNLSLNEIAAHYTPSADDETLAEGLLKVDIGVSVNGYIADVAFSLDLTEDKRYEDMIKLNEKVLENAISGLNSDSLEKDIGNSIYDEIEHYNRKNETGFAIIQNLSGHSLDKDNVHAGLTISNYKNSKTAPLKDSAFAVEPFLTTGLGHVTEGKASDIFVLQTDELGARDRDARELLKFIIENYKTRPFCKRWLEKKGFKKINFLLKILENQGILHNYPVLIEKSKKPVSQAEHTILILGKDVIVTTR